MEHGIVACISGITIWRWLNADAIKPWQYRSWIFPRDPQFTIKAGPILDLYQKKWDGLQTFEGLVDQVMSQEPYRSARRVFWIMGNGSSHRGQLSDERLAQKWGNIIPVLTLAELEARILMFQDYYETVAKPSPWRISIS